MYVTWEGAGAFVFEKVAKRGEVGPRHVRHHRIPRASRGRSRSPG